MSPAARLANLARTFSVHVLAVFTLSACLASGSWAHEVRPAYLDLKEEAPGTFDVLFKTPMVGDLRLSLGVSFSAPVQRPSRLARPAMRWSRPGEYRPATGSPVGKCASSGCKTRSRTRC